METRPKVSFKLYLITDRRVVKNGDLISACEESLAAARQIAPVGSVALQLREKDLPAREVYELALRLREICSRHGALFFVNDRVDVAIASNADGVHLPFDSIGVSMARKLLPEKSLVGVSTHSPPDLANAVGEGADFAVFGPVFDPISKPATHPAWGPTGLAAACRAGAIPVFALGGITPDRTRELLANPNPPAGVATIGAILAAESPAAAITSILSALLDNRLRRVEQ